MLQIKIDFTISHLSPSLSHPAPRPDCDLSSLFLLLRFYSEVFLTCTMYKGHDDELLHPCRPALAGKYCQSEQKLLVTARLVTPPFLQCVVVVRIAQVSSHFTLYVCLQCGLLCRNVLKLYMTGMIKLTS